MSASQFIKGSLLALISLLVFISVGFGGDFKNKGTLVNAASKNFTVTGTFQNFLGATRGIVQNAGTIGVTGNYVNAGTADGLTVNYIGASGGTIDVTGNYQNVTGFTWNSLAASTIKLSGALSNGSGTLATDTGKVVYRGAGQSVANSIKAKTYGTLEIGTGATGTATLSGDSTYANSLTLTAATLDESGKVLVLNGTVATGGGTLVASTTNSTTIYNASGTQSVLASTYYNVRVQNTGQKSALGGVTVSSLLSVATANDSLDFAANAFTLQHGASVTSSGKLKASGSVSVSPQNPTIGGTFVYYGATQTVAGANYSNLLLRTGTFTLPASDSVAVSGTYSLESPAGTTYGSGNAFIYNGTGAQSIVGGQSYYKLLAQGSTDTSLSNAKTVASTFTIQTGGSALVLGTTTLEMGANSITFAGTHTDSVQGTARIRWAGSNQHIAGTGLTELYGSGASTVDPGTYGYLWLTGSGAMNIAGSVVAQGGSATFASIGVTVANNLTVDNGGSLTATGIDLNNDGLLTNNGSITVN